jgi:hypothetical protein
MTSQGSPYQRFQRAVRTGNPLLVRTAAAELPRIGIPEAAMMLLVVLRAEPDKYERMALRWLAKLSTEAVELDLVGLAQAATALAALPAEPGARAVLAEVCRDAGLPDAARVFGG